jgi:hypothetical protein
MKRLKSVVASHRNELSNHVLFELLATSRSTVPLAKMARALAWWPMVFQDVLRLNVERVRGTELERFAEYHRVEDSGHDRWFLDDLRAFDVEEPSLDALFGETFLPVRDACYALMGEVYREQTPAQRVALLLALEPTGHLFFEQVSDAVDRLCPDLPLRYFARSHLGVEKDHDLFAESTNASLDRIELSDAERAESEAAIQRIYSTFTAIFSYLADRMSEAAPQQSYIAQLHGTDVSVRDASGAR